MGIGEAPESYGYILPPANDSFDFRNDTIYFKCLCCGYFLDSGGSCACEGT